MKWPEMKINNNGTTFQMTTLIGDNNNNFVIVIEVQPSTVVVHLVQLKTE